MGEYFIAIYKNETLSHSSTLQYVLKQNCHLFETIYIVGDESLYDLEIKDFENLIFVSDLDAIEIPKSNEFVVCELNPNILLPDNFIECVKNTDIQSNKIYTFDVYCYETYSELVRSINHSIYEGKSSLIKVYMSETKSHEEVIKIDNVEIRCIGNIDNMNENYYNFVFDDQGGKLLRENLRNLSPSLYWPSSLRVQKQPRIFSRRFKNQIEKYKEMSICRHNTESLKESVKLNKKDIPVNSHHDVLKVITSYYEVETDSRRNEVEYAIKKNIENELIDEVVVFTENLKREYEFLQNQKVKEIKIENRFSFKTAMDFVKSENQPNAVYTVCNSDCYFDDTIDLLKKINFKNGKRILAMTRKDLLGNGKIVDSVDLAPFNNENYEFGEQIKIDYENGLVISVISNDAWSFTNETANAEIDFDIELGRWNCEPNFCSRLHKAGYEVRNVGHGGHIRCIHVHQTNLRYKNKCQPQFSSKSCLETEDVTHDNYVVNSWYPMSESNYIFDDRFSGKYGKFYVRDIAKLFD